MNLLELVIGFVVGVAVTVVGGYVLHVSTSRRDARQESSKATDAFERVRSLMPELIAEMVADINRPGNETTRKVIYLPHKRIVYNSREAGFVYYENEHQNLSNKMIVLQNAGYLVDVTTGNTPTFRITEEFAAMLRT